MKAKTPFACQGSGGLERWDALKSLLSTPSTFVNSLLQLAVWALRWGATYASEIGMATNWRWASRWTDILTIKAEALEEVR